MPCNCQNCQQNSQNNQPISDPEQRIKKYWRPAMAWSYLAICLFDFLIAPILLGLYTLKTKQNYVAWVPLTTQNGGLLHLSMGAIIGITSWTRGQEKMAFMQTGYAPTGGMVGGTMAPVMTGGTAGGMMEVTRDTVTTNAEQSQPAATDPTPSTPAVQPVEPPKPESVPDSSTPKVGPKAKSLPPPPSKR